MNHCWTLWWTQWTNRPACRGRNADARRLLLAHLPENLSSESGHAVWYQVKSYYAAATNFRARELMQKRRPVGLGPSVKTWPRWPSQTRQETAVRTSIRVPSGSSLMFSSAIGSQKLGHPVPESNFVLELKRSSSHPAQRNTPRR